MHIQMCGDTHVIIYMLQVTSMMENVQIYLSLLLTLYSLILCIVTQTVVVIQDGETALDLVRERKSMSSSEDVKSRSDEVIKYLEEFGK